MLMHSDTISGTYAQVVSVGVQVMAPVGIQVMAPVIAHLSSWQISYAEATVDWFRLARV